MSYVIGTCGFCATGSSAVTDYLKEFDDVVTLDNFEFTLPYRTDGLQDLAFHLHEGSVKHNSAWIAIKRFKKLCYGYGCRELKRDTHGEFVKLTEDYLKSIIQAEWVGAEVHESEEVVRSIFMRGIRKLKLFKYVYSFEQKRGTELALYPLRKMTFAANPDDFDEKTKRYVMSVLDALGRQRDKSIALDQPFAGNNPQATFPFFENPLAIVVDRDPRDYYMFYKKFLYAKGRRAAPIGNVKDFITFYRKERENMPYLQDDPRILRIQFEDMIYRYDETTKKIRDFCGLGHANRKRKLFAPEMSINNTQVFKRYPEYAEDINYIEENLKEYLFPFEQFGDVKIDGEMFLGRSPLNNR